MQGDLQIHLKGGAPIGCIIALYTFFVEYLELSQGKFLILSQFYLAMYDLVLYFLDKKEEILWFDSC